MRAEREETFAADSEVDGETAIDHNSENVYVRVIAGATVILEVHENGKATLIVIPTVGKRRRA